MHWFCQHCIALPFNHLNDEDFSSAIFCDVYNVPTLEELNRKLFNPFDINDEDDAILMDVNSDVQFYNAAQNVWKCNYYTIDKFVRNSGNSFNNFSIIHTNIRSACKNLHNFETYLANLKHSFTIIGLSETWFNEAKSEIYNVKGYNCIYKCRGIKSGGGVS